MKKKKEVKNEVNLKESEVVKNKEEEKCKIEGISIFDEFLLEEDWDKTENIYKNKILKKKWIKENKYLNLKKFKSNISSYHYFDSHISSLQSKFIEKNFKSIYSSPNFFSNPNTKKLFRQGVPPKFIHRTLLNFFEIKEINENNYNKLYSIIFKEHDIKNLDNYVPYFTGKKTLKESLSFHYLNKEGKLELKILLWMLNETYRNVIIYCPYLIKIISLILIFCNKYETFEILCKLIDIEIKDKEKIGIKQRLRFTKYENELIYDSIDSCISDVNHNQKKKKNEYYYHLNKINFDKKEIYKDMLNDFFINYLNFYGIIRLLPLFFLQGFKSFYRIICSIENEIIKKEIKFSNKEEVINKIREYTKKLDVDEIFKNSYSYKFKLNKKEENKEEISNEDNEFYLPYYKGGNLLTDYEIIHLWELLPPEFKIKNASIIYQAAKDGYNLPNILELENKFHKNTYILLLIETTEGDKFGFVNSNLLIHTDNKYQRPNSTYLFTLRPQFKIYSPNVDSDEILYITNQDFIFGNGPNGPAIQLNQDIMKGVSYEGGCFNNPCLVGNPEGHFIVTKLEIFKLIIDPFFNGYNNKELININF